MSTSRRVLLGVTLAPALVVLGAGGAALGQEQQPQPEPYRDPPFDCQVIHYGTEPPELPGPTDDPLCVRYDKTNATVSTLGIVDFLAAEPGRIGLVAAKCAYWQQDDWAISLTPDTPPLVAWNGSYWYDAATGSAGGILRDLRVADQPASGTELLDAIRPIIGDDQADQIAPFLDDGGGGGMTMQLPDGFGAGMCARDSDEPSDDGHVGDDTPSSATSGPDPLVQAAADQSIPTLPTTGSDTMPIAGIAVVVAAITLVTRCVLGASRPRPPMQ